LRTAFFKRFWIAGDNGCHLGDVWRDGILDKTIRPNQIFAVSLPYSILGEEYQPHVVECVRNRLLTPFGLRTLAPDDPAYKGRYEGSPDARDAAYHQGTVWPWLLGHYADALLRTVWDAEGAVAALLDTLTPLFSDHLTDAGLGGISEIFDASPPYRPNGCINQAWSVAECLRLLLSLKKAAPAIYTAWEKRIAHRLSNPPSGDTAGICRTLMTLA
jgi:glycogen debranching enzyme